MHLNTHFNHFNPPHWVALQCEVSEATPAVAVASEASKVTCIYILMHTGQSRIPHSPLDSNEHWDHVSSMGITCERCPQAVPLKQAGVHFSYRP